MNKHIGKRFILALSVVIACFHTGKAAIAQESPAKLTVVTGIDPSFAFLTIAAKKGFFQQEGLDVTLRAFDDGNVALDNLLTGNAQIGSTSEVGTLVRVSKGAPISVVASAAQSDDLYGIVGKDSISAPQDLIGKTIGMTKGSGGHLYFGYYAQQKGLDTSKSTLRFLQSPEAVAALSRGDIDAMATWEPWLSRVKNTVGGTHIISRTGQDHAYRMNIYLLFAKALIEDRNTSEKALRAIVKAADWIPQNWDEAVKITAEANRMDPRDTEALMKLVTWNIHFDRADFEKNFDGAGKFAISQSLMKTMPSFDFLDGDVLKSVAPSRVK